MKQTARWSFDTTLSRDQYVRRLLDSYRHNPTTAGHVRRADRHLAQQLYEQEVPLDLVEAAFSLAAGRRIFRDLDVPPLAPVRSLHYFLPVIDEIRENPIIVPEYIRHVDDRVRNADQILAMYRPG